MYVDSCAGSGREGIHPEVSDMFYSFLEVVLHFLSTIILIICLKIRMSKKFFFKFQDLVFS
jgi:hypothetical protein